ncbi:hypothetical protein LJC46_02340, partial [Desulfovibrio sp. OttesenSCG-928-G15]|nr:hypothetical protein [Desulfovibrio sp. OttesenSCG-928-G15]
MRPKSAYIAWIPLFFSLLGLAWCGYISFPTAAPSECATSGCALFKDSRIAGISLWWIGGAYFFTLSILCLKGALGLARLLSLLALLGDAVLLLIMYFTAPCLDCLIVAVFIGLGYVALQRASNTNSWFTTAVKLAPSFLLPLWLGLFAGNAALALGEQIPPYAIGKPISTEIRIFFSPSCPACRSAVQTLGDKAALIPVQENDEDFASIVKFRALLSQGLPPHAALARSRNEQEPMPDLSLLDRLGLRVRLMLNKAALFKQGFRALPLVQINGMPIGKDPVALQTGEPQTGTAPPQRRNAAGAPPMPDDSLPDFLDNMDNIA